MENKVIAKEYVDKNYIHKDVIREIVTNYDLITIAEKLRELLEDK